MQYYIYSYNNIEDNQPDTWVETELNNTAKRINENIDNGFLFSFGEDKNVLKHDYFINGKMFLYDIIDSLNTVGEQYQTVDIIFDDNTKKWYVVYTTDKDVRLVYRVYTNLHLKNLYGYGLVPDMTNNYSITIPKEKYELWNEVATHTIYGNLPNMIEQLVDVLVQNIDSDTQNIAFVAMSDEDKNQFDQMFGDTKK